MQRTTEMQCHRPEAQHPTKETTQLQNARRDDVCKNLIIVAVQT
jgi:hypothetical protein